MAKSWHKRVKRTTQQEENRKHNAAAKAARERVLLVEHIDQITFDNDSPMAAAFKRATAQVEVGTVSV